MCVDDYSRVAYAEVLPDERKQSAVAFLKRAVRWFEQFGIQVKRVLTDNGSCYKSKLWHAVNEQLEIRVKKTRPYHPQTNGKAERFIQTLIREWAYFRVYSTSNERKAVLPMFLRTLQRAPRARQRELKTTNHSDAWCIQRCWNSQLAGIDGDDGPACRL